MTINIVPLDSKKHSALHIKVDQSYSHVSAQNMVPLNASEYLPSSTNFPIVFVKQQETGQFKSVGLLGLNTGENLVFSDGKVNSTYIPVNVKRYPFAIGAENENEESMVLCIDENSSLLNESDGVRIFNDDGKPSESTNSVSELLIDTIAKEKATDNFIAFLLEHDLIQSANLTLKLGNEGERKINGIYKIDEDALNDLDDDVVLTMYKRKYFGAIYAHLASLSQFNRLLQLKAKFNAV